MNNEKPLELLCDYLNNLTPEEKEELKFIDNTPKGWLSIEDHLPMMKAKDIMLFASEYKVKYEDGTESITTVSDHNIWYYYAKEVGITHWFND